MTSVSTLGQSIDTIERIKVTQLQLATLQQQIATGKKTQTFAGLGTDIIASKRARSNFTKLDNYINNIDVADRRLKMMVEAVRLSRHLLSQPALQPYREGELFPGKGKQSDAEITAFVWRWSVMR